MSIPQPFADLARDLNCPPDCYLLVVLSNEYSVVIVSKPMMKPLHSVWLAPDFEKNSWPDLRNVYCSDNFIPYCELSYKIMKAFTLKHLIKKNDFDLTPFTDIGGQDFFTDDPEFAWIDKFQDMSRSFPRGFYRLLGKFGTFAIKIS